MIENKILNSPPDLPEGTCTNEKRDYPRLSINEVVQIIMRKCDPTNLFKYSSGKNYVVILPEAWEELKMLIGWGKVTPFNIYEQLYEGMGHYLSNGDGKWILVVTHFLYIYAANRTPISACIMKNGKYDSILERIEYEREIYCKNEEKYNRTPSGRMYNPFIGKCGPSEVNLYGHSHPNIGVFFSPDDKTSGFAAPDYPAATFVADPIRKQLKAMVGVEQEEAQILVFEYKNGIQNEKKKSKEDGISDKRACSEIIERGAGNSSRKPAKELVIELGRTCNELLDPVYGSTGNYVAKTTFTGKEHIKVDIKLNQKVKNKRRTKNSFSVGEPYMGGYDAYA